MHFCIISPLGIMAPSLANTLQIILVNYAKPLLASEAKIGKSLEQSCCCRKYYLYKRTLKISVPGDVNTRPLLSCLRFIQTLVSVGAVAGEIRFSSIFLFITK